MMLAGIIFIIADVFSSFWLLIVLVGGITIGIIMSKWANEVMIIKPEDFY